LAFPHKLLARLGFDLLPERLVGDSSALPDLPVGKFENRLETLRVRED
jgi:hypothetical protein